MPVSTWTEWTSDDMVIEISGGNLGAPVNVEARWKKIKLAAQVESIEITRGPNKRYKNFRPGIVEIPLEMTLGINAADILPDELHIEEIYTIAVYPLGKVASKPMHSGTFFIEELPLDIESGRGERVYQVKFKQADDPTLNYFDGAVYTP